MKPAVVTYNTIYRRRGREHNTIVQQLVDRIVLIFLVSEIWMRRKNVSRENVGYYAICIYTLKRVRISFRIRIEFIVSSFFFFFFKF